MKSKDKAALFLAVAPEFKLGHLVTEAFHPKTVGLSRLVQENLPRALSLLREVDSDALKSIEGKEGEIAELAHAIQDTLTSGNKVFLCGCGATGRLSLVLETLYRQKHGPTDQVISFMAGGDYALIKSVESFEDRVDFGERQLRELGFGAEDLLLASTEGGETPFVIGAVNAASSLSRRKQYFLYCNPDQLLMSIERSREVLQNPRIKKLNLTVGPMAISGSTRMQASTVLMLSAGLGLLGGKLQDLLPRLRSLPYEAMAPLTKREAELYQEGKYLNYFSHRDLAISILTDTTERSPTFSLAGFENHLEAAQGHALSYLFVMGTGTSSEAWDALLSRPPRALDWEGLPRRIDREVLLGFDISEAGATRRGSEVSCENFFVNKDGGEIVLTIGGRDVRIPTDGDPLFEHLAVKLLLNAHSTLIMGLLGRYEGNVMTYVRPSNNKLIDRAARYCLQLLARRGVDKSYEEVVEKIFEEIDGNGEGPIVIRTVKALEVSKG